MSEDEAESTQGKRPPAAARKRNPEDSRRRILDAAERAFAARGFGGARLRDIAQEAGVHHALVHHYFNDKRGLLEQVIQRGLERMAEAGRAALDAQLTLEGTVRAFVGVLFDFCANNRGLLRILNDALRNRALASLDVTQQTIQSRVGPLLERLKQAIEGAQKHGIVRDDVTVDSLILLGLGAIVHRFDIAERLLVAMGLPRRSDADLIAEREHTIRYVLSAMRASAMRPPQ
jgi:AcrR family transcriptional regulator